MDFTIQESDCIIWRKNWENDGQKSALICILLQQKKKKIIQVLSKEYIREYVQSYYSYILWIAWFLRQFSF